jgi:hypothetical protein
MFIILKKILSKCVQAALQGLTYCCVCHTHRSSCYFSRVHSIHCMFIVEVCYNSGDSSVTDVFKPYYTHCSLSYFCGRVCINHFVWGVSLPCRVLVGTRILCVATARWGTYYEAVLWYLCVEIWYGCGVNVYVLLCVSCTCEPKHVAFGVLTEWRHFILCFVYDKINH